MVDDDRCALDPLCIGVGVSVLANTSVEPGSLAVGQRIACRFGVELVKEAVSGEQAGDSSSPRGLQIAVVPIFEQHPGIGKDLADPLHLDLSQRSDRHRKILQVNPVAQRASVDLARVDQHAQRSWKTCRGFRGDPGQHIRSDPKIRVGRTTGGPHSILAFDPEWRRCLGKAFQRIEGQRRPLQRQTEHPGHRQPAAPGLGEVRQGRCCQQRQHRQQGDQVALVALRHKG